MYGASIGTLNVYVKTSTANVRVFTQSGNKGNNWLYARVPLNTVPAATSGPFQLSFEGIRGTSFTGDIAIDDIGFYDDCCAGSTSANLCTTPIYKASFKSTTDSFYNAATDSFDWTRPATALSGTAPRTDAVGSGPTQYLSTYIPSSVAGGKSALLFSPLFTSPPIPAACQIRFYYWKYYSSTISSSNLNLLINGKMTTLWTAPAGGSTSWRLAQVTLAKTALAASDFQLVFAAVRGNASTDSYLGLDEITFSDGCCVGGISTCTSTITTFNSGFDGYTQDKTDKFDWTRQRGSTGSISTGPSSDQSGSGYYMYIETSSPRVSGDVASLLSPVYSAPVATCQFSFFYHMYGATVNRLTVNAVPSSGSAIQLWTLSGNQGNSWKSATVSLSKVSTVFQLQFVATSGSSFTGDIAIDTIAFSSSCCAVAQKSCYVETATFDIGLNGYTQVKTDNTDWTRRTGSTTSTATGPTQDATPDTPINGYYMYLETSGGSTGNNAKLLSPVFNAPSTPKSCHVNFFYHMYGSSIGTLNVRLIAGSINKVMFTQSGGSLNSWRWKDFFVGQTTKFQLEFEAIRGGSFTGDIAIDQISVRHCCPESPCVVKPTDFEIGGPMGWYPGTGNLQWNITTGSTPTTGTGPTNDFTFKNASGHYIFLVVGGGSSGDSATLLSPTYLPPRRTGGQMQFSYNMFGSGIGTLSLDMIVSGVKTSLWTKTGNQGTAWQTAKVTISASAPYQLQFTGTYRGALGNIALDDIKADLATYCVDWSQYSSTVIKQYFPLGERVVRGRDWSWGLQDGGTGAFGNITGVLDGSSTGWVRVRWSNNHLNSYRMGASSKYDLYRVAEFATPGTPTVPPAQATVCSLGLTDFETTGLNSWKQSKTDKFDWTIDNGGTPSISTGPSIDHTLGTAAGHYLYIETSSTGTSDNAVLVSPSFQPVYAACKMSFWYHMYGSAIGTLNVKLYSLTNSITSTAWTKSGNQGNAWLLATVALSPSLGNFQIMFEGIDGTSFTGDIAIDDISFETSCCKDCHPTVAFGNTTSSSYQGFWEEGYDTTNWRLQKGATGSSSTGPPADHTGAGYYAYLETSSPRRAGDNAVLVSPAYLPPTSGNCKMTFWYHMYGTTIGTLKVFINSYYGQSMAWSKSGNQGNLWISTSVTVPQYRAWVHTFRFEAIAGSSFTGDIAIDDISFSADCGCVSCSSQINFETTRPLTSLVQSKSDKFDWTLAAGATPSGSTGPSVDHTTGTGTGRYIYMETSGRSVGDTAVISMPKVPAPPGPACALVFWYHMYGSSIGTLAVALSGSSTSMWSKTGSQGNFWQRAVVPITGKTGFGITFTGTVGTSFTGDIALDDIWLTPDCCTSRPDLSKFNTKDLAYAFRTGVRVIRGKDWSWGTQGSGGPGSITQGLGNYSSTGWVQVRWDDGHLNAYRMGSASKYDLYLQIPAVAAIVVSPTPTAPSTAPTTSPTLPPLQPGCEDWTTYTTAQLAAKFKLSTRVTPYGRDWSWGSQNGGKNGTVIGALTAGYVRVTWDNGYTNSYRMGATGKYDLCIEVGVIGSPNAACTTPALDFEETGTKALGNWTQDTKDDFDWSIHSASTGSFATGPTNDHTFGNSSGHYIYIETSFPRTRGDVARLSSPVFTSNVVGCRVVFWYHMYGGTVGNLTLTAQNIANQRTFTLWTMTGDQGDKWQRGSANIANITGSFRLTFTAVTGSSFTGDIALDDIYFDKSCCGNPTCGAARSDFASGMDGFTQVSTDDFDWTRSNGRTSSSGTGPSFDHTTNTTSGYYMYIETSLPRTSGDKAQLMSPLYQEPSTTCSFTFWYHMYGASIGSLNVYIVRRGINTRVFSQAGQIGNRWVSSGSLKVGLGGQFQVMFEGVTGSSFTGDIAIDDFQFSQDCCPTSACTAAKTPTTWDTSSGGSSFQGYIQDASDNFDWSLDNGGTSSFSTGPGTDHTSGTSSGYYAYIETSFPRRVSDVARLISPVYTSDAKYCGVTFWYHMYGTTVGTLNVYIRTPFKTTKLWSKSGNQGNNWLLGTASIGSTDPEQFQLIFEGIVGTSFTGDIGLDDIALTQACCKGTVPTTCGTAAINFEPGYEGYTQSSQDKFDWTRQTGGTSSFSTGPSSDHTTGSGYYLFIETSSPRRRGDNAIIASPTYNNSLQLCSFDFWYHMYGTTVGTLNVYINQTGTAQKLAWSRSGNNGNRWKKARVPVGRFLDTFQIVFEGVVGTSFTGDIAIDDISFNTDCCAVVCPDDYSPYNTFQMSYIFGPGVRVQRGPDWLSTYGNVDGGLGALGTVIAKLGSASPGVVTVQWDAGQTALYRVGTQLDVCRANALPDYSQFSNQTLTGMFTSGIRVIRGRDWKWGAQDGNSEGIVTLSTNTSNSPGWVHATFVAHQNSYRVGAEGAFDLWRVRDLIPINYTIPISSTAPPTVQPVGNLSSIPCGVNNDFENGLSGFIQDRRDTFDWSVGSGSTPSSATGPASDHTYGNSTGKYLFIEASSPRRAGDYARLFSPAYQPAETVACGFSFWYHMSGTGTGNLTVQLATPTSLRTIFSKAGDQTSVWQQAQVPLPTVSFVPWFQLVFVATVGPSFSSDISIDDFRFYKDCCSACNGPQTFESGLSGWTQDTSDDFDWTLDRAGTSSSSTGPNVDHTFGTSLGQYLYIETSFPRVNGDEAVITSPLFSAPRSDLCSMTFWYHMFGTTINELSVGITYRGTTTVLWTKKGNQGNRWISASVKLPSSTYSGPFQISFRGLAGTSFTGDIGIDDVSFSDECCPGCNGPTTFDSGKLPANFASTSSGSTSLTWKVTNTALSAFSGPTADHTTGKGYFAYVDSSATHASGSTVTLSGPILSAPTSPSCSVTLFYNMFGVSISKMAVNVRQAGGPVVAGRTFLGNLGNVWRSVTIAVPMSAGHFQLEVTGTLNTGSLGYMAIDDIIYSTGCCNNAVKPPIYSVYSDAQMIGLFPIGTRVVRGKDFVYSHPGSSGVGNVTTAWSAGYVKVAWGTSSVSYTYAMGANGLYELYRLADLLTGAVTFAPTSPQPTTPPTPNYALLSIPQLAIMFGAGTRVLRGRDWQYSFQDGGPTGRGTVQKFVLPTSSSAPALVQVKWDNGNVYSYRMGAGSYDLARVQDIGLPSVTGPFITTAPPTPSAPINYGAFSIAQLQLLFPVGTLVTRGRDWKWGDLDVSPTMVGNVSIALDAQGYVQVTWANGFVGFYRMGYANAYDLYRLVDLTSPPTPPVVTTQPTPTPACRPRTTFESGLMGYTNDASNDIDWGLNRGNTGSFATGPSVDHTLGNSLGQYVYLETSSPASAGDEARLISPAYPSPPGSICQATFWYHMYGATIGTLNVYIKLSNGTSLLAWTKKGDQGDTWYQAQFAIGKTSGTFQLVFEGIAGTSFTGDISIDDVSFGIGCCGASPDYSIYGQAQLAGLFAVGTRVVRGKDWQWGSQDSFGQGTVTANLTSGGYLQVRWDNGNSFSYRMGALSMYDLYRVIDLTYTLPPTAATAAPGCVTYDFEDGTDGFVQSQSGDDDFDWSRGRSGTSSFGTGPSIDHTLGTPAGSYMFIETSFPRVIGDRAIMLSPAFNPPPRAGCSASIWIHMYGVDIDRLEIWLITNAGNTSLLVVPGDHGDVWMRRTLSLASVSTAYRLLFIGYVGPSFQGDIAIDDLTFEAGCCPVYPDYSAYSPARIMSTFPIGTRVIRGKDWSWGSDDGGKGGTGTVTSALSSNGYMQVTWDAGKKGSYRMGASGMYDLYLAPVVSCNPLSPPTYGSLTGGYNIHDTVTLTCQAGYTLSGPATRTCTSMGSWTNGATACVKTSADYSKYTAAELAAIFTTGARVVRGPNWVFGTQDKSGPGTIIQGLGAYVKPNHIQVAWDYAKAVFYEYQVGAGTFEVQLYAASSCPVLKAPVDGSITANTGKFGEKVTVTCRTGYALQGSISRTCQAPGLWSGLTAVCSAACKASQWQCDDGTCIPKAGHCDGLHTDCSDGSDEKYCSIILPTAASNNCTAAQFACATGACIPKAQNCDGNWWDCVDGSDEIGCTNTTAQSLPDYSTYTAAKLQQLFHIGARVVRGKDWSYGSQDDFGVGTIISNFTASYLVQVQWDSGRIFSYRMGYSSKYDLYLVQGTNCPALQSILYGFVTTSGLAHNDVGTYSCKSGYVLQGIAQRTCVGGFWSGSQPTCVLPANATRFQDYSKLSPVVIANLFKVGTRVVPGQDWIWGNQNGGLPGTVVSTISAAGWMNVIWDNNHNNFYRMANGFFDLALANVSGCLPLGSPANGYQQGTGTAVGDSVSFGCFPPYVLQGPTVRTCQADGFFDGIDSYCAKVIQPCTSSQVRCAGSTVCIAKSAWCDGKQFDCPDGSDELYCGSTNTTGKNCTALTAPLNGKVTGTGVTPGTGLFFACNAPYVLQGSVVRYCDVSGTWSGVPATCSIPDIPCKYHEFKCGGSGGCISATKVCDGVWYDCPDGSDESNCTSTRGTAAPGQDCLPQQTPPNGYIQGASMTSYGSQIAFGCYQPYVLQGSATRTCQLSGKWDGVPPVCTLASPCKSGFQPCRDGTCLASSKFCNGVFFECPDNTDEYQCGTTGPGVCTPLAKPTNGYSQGTNYSAGGSVVFGCNSGYNLQGSIVRICQIDGSWSGAAASCNPIQLQCKSGYLSCLRSSGCILPSQRCDGVWYDCADGSDEQYCPGKATPAPGQTDCQVLSPPALGSMTVNGLMFTNTTTFVCTSPYVLMGSAVRTCEINGQWSGVQPTCVLTTAVCRYNQWRCHSGQCITQSARCNGHLYDCRDGSDELYCPATTPTPQATQVFTGTPVPPTTTQAPATTQQTGTTAVQTEGPTTRSLAGQKCPSALDSCQNGASCQLDADGLPICFCKPGYSGLYCQHQETGVEQPCAAQVALACSNGGRCNYNPNTGITYCQCPVGFGGLLCRDQDIAPTEAQTGVGGTTANNTALLVGVGILAGLVLIVALLAIIFVVSRRKPQPNARSPAPHGSGFERFNDDLPLTSGMETPTGSLRGMSALGGPSGHSRPGISNPLYSEGGEGAINY
ncbi:MAM and LDL-receptor class A domain-containing protein 1-like [Sycon ciliatum]|uniref:MAM and LDL-receptor class A domain-containing protein 1-like n=1 Tax=Sycon ciliatum TaxID=27933 RepID=UPI0031F61886